MKYRVVQFLAVLPMACAIWGVLTLNRCSCIGVGDEELICPCEGDFYEEFFAAQMALFGGLLSMAMFLIPAFILHNKNSKEGV